MKGKWRRLILFFFLWSELIFFMIRVDPSPVLFHSYFFIRSESIRSDFLTCLAKTFVCPAPKILHVMMKWCRRASHLGRFTLWHYGRLATQLSRFTLWHKRRWASQLAGKFTLWHNGRRAKQSGLMHAPGVARIFQRKIQSKILLRVLTFSTLLKDERFGRFI